MREAGKPRPGGVVSRGRGGAGNSQQRGEHLALEVPPVTSVRCDSAYAAGLWGSCHLTCTASHLLGVLKRNRQLGICPPPRHPLTHQVSR